MSLDFNKSAITAASIGLTLGLSFGVGNNASAEFRFQPYGALNANISNLDPDPGSSGFSVDESTGSGFGVLLGADIFDRWSIEAAYNDLGSATLTSPTMGDQDIDYTAFSFSTVFHLFGDSRDIADRKGFWTYARLGVSQVDNDSDLTLEEADNTAVWAGIGVEWSFTSLLSLRAELASFDGDAQALSAGLVFRPFSPNSSRSGQRPAVNRAPVTTQAPAPVSRPEAAPERGQLPVPAAPSVSARAPVATAGCESPVFNEPVDQGGCAQLSGVRSGVQFNADSAQLTSQSSLAIANLAAALRAAPELRIEIHAHASSNSGPAAAQDIARQRVVAVARALVAAGVSVDRLGARAFGNEEPRVTLGASTGQFLPDRIEFIVQR